MACVEKLGHYFHHSRAHDNCVVINPLLRDQSDTKANYLKAKTWTDGRIYVGATGL